MKAGKLRTYAECQEGWQGCKSVALDRGTNIPPLMEALIQRRNRNGNDLDEHTGVWKGDFLNVVWTLGYASSNWSKIRSYGKDLAFDTRNFRA